MTASVATQDAGSLVLPVRVVNGHLVVLTDLVGLRYTNEASFEISFEYPDALTLHPDQYAWLGLGPDDLSLTTPPIVNVLISPGIRLSIPATEIAIERSAERVRFQNLMTKLHSTELGERKLKGTIGIGLLKKYQVTLDLTDKRLVLEPPRTPGQVSPVESADIVIKPFDYVDNTIQVGIAYADDRRGRMVIGGTEYDTYIDATVATSLAHPAGDVSPVWLADATTPGKKLDLSQYVAFRPRALPQAATSAERPVLTTGVNFLEYFKIDLDWANQTMVLTERRRPRYPEQDRAFFDAESRGTSDAMLAYLQKYSRERLSPEAAARLVQWRIEKDDAPDADVLKALQWAIDTSLPGRRIETGLFYLSEFANRPGRTQLAIAAGTKGLEYSREASDGRVVYELHHELGRLYLKTDALAKAWRHLLSAAFMAPDDLGISLDLARLYDKQGQVRRAYARYKKLAGAPGLPAEVAREVKAALDRLRKQLPSGDPLLRGETTNPRSGPLDGRIPGPVRFAAHARGVR